MEMFKKILYITICIAISCCVVLAVIQFNGCKPSMPVKETWGDNAPCYLADVCLTVNAYMVNNKTDCTLALQKCYRYTDYDKCSKKSEDERKKCWDDLGVRN